MRQSTKERKTTETDIRVVLNLDGKGVHKISTGIGFFDHMLAQLAVHAQMDLEMSCTGDLEIDPHHTIDDTGLVLGDALKEALGDKRDIARFATCTVPTDEALVMTSVDLGGKPYFIFNAGLDDGGVAHFDGELCEEFFRSVAHTAMFTLHINEFYGKNGHHIMESMFKSFGRALRDAAAVTPGLGILSVKGTY